MDGINFQYISDVSQLHCYCSAPSDIYQIQYFRKNTINPLIIALGTK